MGLVAYTDPQGVFNKNEDLVLKYLSHINNLYWRPDFLGSDLRHSDDALAQDSTTRSIQHLDLQLVPESGQKSRRHQIPGLNHTPLVQIFVVETISLDIYRSKLRQIGKDWLNNTVQVRDPTGFVVVHAVNSDDSLKARKAIWSRLTSEFDAAHCVQLSVADREDWTNLQNAIRVQLVSAFGLRVDMLCSEIRKLQATQDVPGWNFGAFFAVHDSLAWLYSSMNLLDDSLRVYEILRSAMYNIPHDLWSSKPQMMIPGSGNGITIDLNNSVKVISERDTLIDLVLAQKASYFDIQRYLLEREMSLLLRGALSPDLSESLLDECVYKCIRLAMTRFHLLKRLLEGSVGKKAALVWLIKAVRKMFSVATEVGSSKLSKGKGDLKLLERDYIQEQSALRGWTIPGFINEISLSNNNDIIDHDKEIINDGFCNDEEFGELQSLDSYIKEFINLTLAAINYYRSAQSTRSVAGMTAQIMLIEFHRGNYEECWKHYKKFPEVIKISKQPLLLVLDALLTCAQNLQLHDDVLDLAWKILVRDDAPLDLSERAVEVIKNGPTLLKTLHEISIWFLPKLKPYIQGDSKGYYLELKLIPKRPKYPFVHFDAVKLLAVINTGLSTDKKNIIFESTRAETSGASGILYKLYTRTFVEGILEITRLELHQNNNSFKHDFVDILVAMRPLKNAFNAHITLAKNHCMKKRNIDLKLKSPIAIQYSVIHVKPIDPQLQLLLDRVEGADELSNFTDALISIPVLVNYEHPNLRVKVTIEYDNDFSFEFIEHLNFSLAISVDFQESFRSPPRILTQFLVKPFNQIPTIFRRAKLIGSSNYDVENLVTDHHNQEMMGYSGAPVSYVFSVAKREHKDIGNQNKVMQLSLEYRSLLWECQYLLLNACEAKLGNLKCYYPTLSRIIEQLSSEIDFAEYLCSQRIRIKTNDVVANVVNMSCQYMNPELCHELAQIITSVLDDQNFNDIKSFDFLNSTMQLDVPDPEVDVVHYANIRLTVDESEARKAQITVGQAVSATLEINSMIVQSVDIENRHFEFELDRAMDAWSYTGRIKGKFSGGSRVIEQLSLIPNHTGELFLPNVIIKSIDVHHSSNKDATLNGETVEKEQIVVSQHVNTRILVVPEVNMLAITF